MPFKSKAQQRWMFAAEARGEVPEGTARQWAKQTKNIKKLPEHVKKAFVIGFQKIAGTNLNTSHLAGSKVKEK